jgi:PAS domain S-box-containing protein
VSPTAAEGATAAGERLALPDGFYTAIVSSSDDAILSKDAEGTITSWNPGAERIYGYTAEEAIGNHISMLIPPNRAGEEKRILARVLAGERMQHYETERRRKDGRIIAVSLTVSPVRDATGAITGASVIARDVSSRRRTEILAARLQAVSSALAKEVNPARAIEALLDHAVAALEADAGAVGLVSAGGDEVELVGSSGYSESGLSGWRSFPLEAELPMSVAIRTGESIWMRSGAELQERFPLLAGAEIRFESLAVIPLGVEGDRPGSLALSFRGDRDFSEEERAFLAAVAQQASFTLERARLYEAERQARERLAFLAEATELLSGSLDLDATLRRLAEVATRRIADWCAIDLVGDGSEVRHVVVAHRDPERVQLAEELRERYPTDPDAETGVPHVIRTGETEVYAEIPDEMLVEAAQDAEHLRLMRELGLASAMVMPLRARGRTLGAVTFVASESSRRFGDDDLTLAEELARRAALAVDNSMLFRREHEAALTLQRSLLPRSMPELDAVEFAARYYPAGAGLEVGGDWYEALALDNGRVGVTIGDIAGRGIRAAAIMGRVGTALRAYVLDCHRPGDALERLDRLMREFDQPEMTTIFHLQLDPATGSAEYVRAGHPPALLRSPDGRVTQLAGSGTPPLGVLAEVQVQQHSVEIPPGSTLLLFTDGLVERPGSDLAEGLGRLEDALAAAPADLEACLDAIARQFDAEEVPDDVAMLAMRPRP